MRASWAALAVTLVLGCGRPASTLTLTASGEVTSGASPRSFSVSSGWIPDSDSVGASSGSTYGPTFVSTSGNVTRVGVRFDSLKEPLALGAGAWGLQLAVLFTDGVQHTFDSVPAAVFISRLRDTGLRDVPFEVVGTIDGAAPGSSLGLGETGSATVRGDFVFRVPCHTEGSASFFTPSALCGSNTADVNGTFTSKPTTGDYATVDSTCPEAIKALFLDGTHYTYSVTQLKVGAAQALACRIVGSDNDSESPPISASRICTGTATLEADGCTWTVDARSSPAREVVVNGLATAACTRSAGRACQVWAR